MTPESDAQAYEERYEAIYRGLPPLDSPEYLKILETAPPEALPGEVLVRVYRQLCEADPGGKSARTTIERLTGTHQRYYFQRVISLAYKDVGKGKSWLDAEDLIQDVMAKLCEILSKPRGRHAASNWVVFTVHLYRDVWRTYFGREGAKRNVELAGTDADSATMRSDVEVAAEYKQGAGPRGCGFDQTARIETVISETVAKIRDPFLKQVAEDQFGPDPKPISTKREQGTESTLSGRLGVSRHRVERALKQARLIVGAALMADKTLELEDEWIRSFINTNGSRG